MVDDDTVRHVRISSVKSSDSDPPIVVIDELWLIGRKSGKSTEAAKQMIEQQQP